MRMLVQAEVHKLQPDLHNADAEHHNEADALLHWKIQAVKIVRRPQVGN